MQRIVGILWMMMASVCAAAQTDTLTRRTHHLEGVTVTAARQAKPLTSTAPLHQLDQHDMLAMGVTDIADALHRLPGITLRDYGGAGGMKTVSVRGFGAKHTGVCYDGVMLSECQSGEIDLSRYSLDNVDMLSLTIGDNDDIFIPARQSSTPAVLSIQTLQLSADDGKPHLTAQLKAGSFGFVSPFLRYDQNVSNRFSLSLMGEYTYAENDYPYTIQNGTLTQHDRRTHNRMNSGHAEIGFQWRLSDRSQMTGKAYYYDNDRQLPGQVRYYTNLSGETLHDRNFFGQLSFQSRCSNNISLRAHAKFNWAASSYRDALMAGGVNDADYWQREVYSSLAVLYVPTEHWAFSYAADYAYNNLNGSSWRTVVGRPYRHSILQAATAKYHGRRLTLVGRLLYSLYLNDTEESSLQSSGTEDSPLQQSYSARNMRRLSPSLSLSWRLWADRDLYLRASYKNIFRSPTFNESYYYHYGSTDLSPEITDQLNVGITYAASKAPFPSRGGVGVGAFPSEEGWSFQLTLDAYYNFVRDMIVAVPYNMFVWSCVNVAKVNVYGIDTTLKLSHHFNSRHALLLSGNYTYQRAENRSNPESPNYRNQIAYIPRHTAGASVTYENPWANIALHGVGVSARWPNNEHYEGTLIDGYIDCGMTLYRHFTFGRHQLEARFDLKNIFDTQYEIVGHYPMPGRSYQISFNYKI